MAIPIHSLRDDELHRWRDSWSLDFGDSRLFDSMPPIDPSPDNTKAANTLNSSTEHHFPSPSADPLLLNFSAVECIEIRDDENSWFSHPVLSPSAPTTEGLETGLRICDVGQDMLISLKERVKAMAQADPRHISRQEKRRDAFIEMRLQQLDAENIGAVGSVIPEWRPGAEADTTSQKCPHYDARNGNGNGEVLQRTGSVIYSSAVNTEFDEASISMSSELSPFRSSSSSGIASGSSMLGSSKHEKAEGGTERQREEQSVQALAGNQSSRNSTFTEMVWAQDMSPASQRPKQTRTKEDKATRLAVRRRSGACHKHKSNKKRCHCRLSGYQSERFKTSSSCAPLIQPDSISRHPPPELEPTVSEDRGPRQIVSHSLRELMEVYDVGDALSGLLYENLPGILRAAAGLLETDTELSSALWLPVLRVVCTIFRSAETLTRHVGISATTINFRKLLYLDLFKMVTLICNILSEDCPTPQKIMRFLECLIEAINDLTHELSLAGVTEDPGLTKANTLKLWLDTAESELHTLRSLLPEDTPVFTCPFPLAGCTYQTTNMQQWIIHKNQCYERRSVCRTVGSSRLKANARLDPITWIPAKGMYRGEMHPMLSELLWCGSKTNVVRTHPTLLETGHDITTLLIFGIVLVFLLWYSRRWETAELPLHSTPKCINVRLFEALYRILGRELLRLFDLCMLSVLPMCTNMLGFVVCWLTILQSVSMWKGKGILRLST